MSKLIVYGCIFSVVFLSGCATTTVVKQGNPDPAGDAYKCVLIKNESPFFVFAPIGTQNILLEPGSEIITKTVRPLGWLSPTTFGRFSFMAYAYRKYDGKSLDEFVGQQEYWIYLDGYPRPYQGRVFGDVVVMSYFPVSRFGFPDQWQGRIAGIIPWKAEFRHY